MDDELIFNRKRINQLPMEVANLVAAGEVVERPASAIKELMENSIDAGATFITVEVQDGGVTLMRVSDDGCGIDRDQLPMAIKRHATSKIVKAEDLQRIGTLGFRGEALAAISAVSEFRMYSRTANDIMGGAIYVSNGEIKEWFDQGCAKGTTIIAEQLFGNVPARRKFLKKDVTETAAVTAVVERIALSHPEIRVRLITDGDLRLETAGDGKLLNTVYSIFGRDFSSRLIEIQGSYGNIQVHGYIGRSDNVRGNRGAQHFYVNGRYVHSKTMVAALEQAYVSNIAPSKFPVCVIFLEMELNAVDVNIHPTKLELKFANEKTVFEAVYYTVKSAIEQNSSRPEMDILTSKMIDPSTQKNSGMKMTDAFAPVGRDEPLSKRQMTIQELLTANLPKDPAGAPGGADKISSSLSINSGNQSNDTHKTGAMDSEQVSHHKLSGNDRDRYEADAAYKDQANDQEQVISYHQFGEYYINDRELLEQSLDDIDDSDEMDPAEILVVEDDKIFGNKSNDQGRPKIDIFQHIYATLPEEKKIIDPVDALMNNTDLCEEYKTRPEPVQANVSEAPIIPSRRLSWNDNDVQTNTQIKAGIGIGEENLTQLPEEPVDSFKPWRIVGQIFNSYIVVEIGDRMLLIDKHAAHERIIFEKLKSNLKSSKIVAQPMMIPIDIMMMSDEVTALSEYREELSRVGFEFEAKRNTISVTSIPTEIEVGAIEDMLTVMADRIKNGTGSVEITRDTIFEKALYQGSCKAAIKAGREYAPEHEKWIVEQIMKIPDITFCPHGRPVAMEMPKDKIDKQFERK